MIRPLSFSLISFAWYVHDLYLSVSFFCLKEYIYSSVYYEWCLLLAGILAHILESAIPPNKQKAATSSMAHQTLLPTFTLNVMASATFPLLNADKHAL